MEVKSLVCRSRLSSAPRVFTKIMTEPFVATVLNKGIRLVIYLDDMVIVSSTREISLEEKAFVIHVLESLGFVINKEKSMLVPSQTVEALGFIIIAVEMTLSLPERKINRVLT